MNLNDQSRSCHPERSEGSTHRDRPFPFAALRASAHCAQGDNTLPMMLVKLHNRPLPGYHGTSDSLGD